MYKVLAAYVKILAQNFLEPSITGSTACVTCIYEFSNRPLSGTRCVDDGVKWISAIMAYW